MLKKLNYWTIGFFERHILEPLTKLLIIGFILFIIMTIAGCREGTTNWDDVEEVWDAETLEKVKGIYRQVIYEGSTVRWINNAQGIRILAGHIRSPRIEVGETYEHTFNEVGTYSVVELITKKKMQVHVIELEGDVLIEPDYDIEFVDGGARFIKREKTEICKEIKEPICMDDLTNVTCYFHSNGTHWCEPPNCKNVLKNAWRIKTVCEGKEDKVQRCYEDTYNNYLGEINQTCYFFGCKDECDEKELNWCFRIYGYGDTECFFELSECIDDCAKQVHYDYPSLRRWDAHEWGCIINETTEVVNQTRCY